MMMSMRKMVNTLMKLALASSGLRQSAVTVVGNALGTGLSAIALILISRLLGPAQFGEFSVGFAIVMILNKINDAGLNATVVKFAPQAGDDHEKANRIFSYTLRLKLVLSASIMIVGAVISPWLSHFLHIQQPAIILFSFLLSAASTWYEHLLSVLQAAHQFTEAVVANALQSGAKAVVFVVFYLLQFKQGIPIFVLYMIAPLVPIVGAKCMLPQWVKIKLSGDFSQEKKVILAMARHSAVGFIAAGLIENVDVLFVQRYLNSYETGLLAGVSRIAMVLLLVAYSLGNVLYPRVARYQTKEHLQPYLRKSFFVLLLTIVGFFAFVPFSGLLILLTIGPAYLPGVPILNILIAGSFLTIATIPFQALFYSLKADWYFSISGLAQLAIMVLGNGLLVPQYGLAASAWTRFVTRLFLFTFTAGVALWLYYRKYHAQRI